MACSTSTAVDALRDEWQVVGFPFDGDAPKALEDGRLDGGAASGKTVENYSGAFNSD